MKEEIGIEIDIEFLFKDKYQIPNKKDFYKHLTSFKADYDGPFEINPTEVQQVKYFSIQEIYNLINQNESFHPELLFLLNKHYFK